MISACLLLGSSFPSQPKMFPTQLILGFCNCLYLEPSGKTLKQSIPHCVPSTGFLEERYRNVILSTR